VAAYLFLLVFSSLRFFTQLGVLKTFSTQGVTNPVSLQLLYYKTTIKTTTTTTTIIRTKISVYCLFHRILTLGPVLRHCHNSFNIMFKPMSCFLIMSTENTGNGKFINKGLSISQSYYAGKDVFFSSESLRHLFVFQEGAC
jgi:hypothetical protein